MYQVKLQSHFVSPAKIVCIGRNFVEHIEELNNKIPTSPILFIKPNSAISDSLKTKNGGIRYEGEISFMIKDSKLKFVAFGLDLTLADMQERLKKDAHPWERCKAFRESALFSDFVSFGDIKNLSLKLYKNGDLVQDSGYELMIFKPEKVIKECDEIFGIDDYDILMSGTPKGVGSFEVGDILRGEILEDGEVITSKEWRCNS